MNEVQLEPTTGFGSSTEIIPRPTFHGDDLLPAASATLDPMGELAELLVKMKVEDRRRSREEKLVEEARIEQAAREQIAALYERADALFQQGLAQGAFAIAGGVFTAYSGFSEEKGWEGIGDASTATGGVLASFDQFGVADAEADLVRAETDRESAERRAAEAASALQLAGDELQALLDAIQKIYEAELAAQKAALVLV